MKHDYTNQEIRQLERIAENSKDAHAAKNAMTTLKKINRTYHYCAEWDYMVICDKHLEFSACLCFK